jgi:hypothetical protein
VLDLDKIVMSGHSFGGITALSTSCKDSRIKVCLPLDPWFLPYKDDYLNVLKLPE